MHFAQREHLLYVLILNGLHCPDYTETIDSIVRESNRLEWMEGTNYFFIFQCWHALILEFVKFLGNINERNKRPFKPYQAISN